MKKNVKTCTLLSLVALFGTSCGTKVDYSTIPDIETVVMEDFEKNKTQLFNVSSGYSNGSPFAVTWQSSNVTYNDGVMNLEIKKDGSNLTGGELKSKDFFQYGSFEVKMKPIKSSGTASTFFTYTGPTDGHQWDEIDIEILGKDTTKVQFNYFTNGVGNHEYIYDLGFDASLEYHDYGFRWEKESITWFVDGKAVYQATEDIPQTEQRILMNAWTSDDTLTSRMGKLPNDFTNDTVKYDEIRYSTFDGKPYEPTFEITPEIDPNDLTWTKLDLDIAGNDFYKVEKVEGKHHITYQDIKGNCYQNVFASLPESSKKANSIRFNITNKSESDINARADVNAPEGVTHGPQNIRCINTKATQDGNEIPTNLEWGGSSFALKGKSTSQIEVRYEGDPSDIMFFFDSACGDEKIRSGDVTISDIEIATYPTSERPNPDVTPDENDIVELDLSFNSNESYKVNKVEKETNITYADIVGDSYKNIYALLGERVKGRNVIEFKIKNNSKNPIQGRCDVNAPEGVTHGTNNIKALNLKAKQDDKEIRTDLEWGGSFFTLDPNKESTIQIIYEGDANDLMFYFDSSIGDKTVHSGDVTVSNFVSKIVK